MSTDAWTIKRGLTRPFPPVDLEWRLQLTTKDKHDNDIGMAVPYVTNRAIQDRLDDVVGPDNWHNEYKPWHTVGTRDSQICGISVYNEERKEWITKWDGAEDTEIEAVKGGLSDSMKRAAVQWGIGRYLYKMDGVWVSVQPRGKSWIIKANERAKLDSSYLEMLKKLGLSLGDPGSLPPDQTAKTDPDMPREGVRAGKANVQAPVQKQQTAKAPGTSVPEQQPSSNITRLPSAKQPKCEYKVNSAKVQAGMNRNPATSLALTDPNGKTIRAFLRGTDDALVSGAELTNVKLTMQRQDTVAFYILDSYEIIRNMPKAA